MKSLDSDPAYRGTDFPKPDSSFLYGRKSLSPIISGKQ
jgi:hypothetical protein